MSGMKLVVLVAIAACLIVGTAASDDTGAADSITVGMRCGTKGGHCETRESCGKGRKIVKGICPGSDVTDMEADAIVCCLPKKAPSKAELKKAAAKKAAALKKKNNKLAKAVKAAMGAKSAKEVKANAAAAAEKKKALEKAVDKTKPEQVKTVKHKLIEPVFKKAGTSAAAAKAEADATKPPSVEAAKAAAKAAKAAAAKKAPKPAVKGGKKGKKSKKSKKSKKAASKKGKKAKKSKAGMKAAKGSRGVDVAQRTSKKQFQCLKKAGWEWAVVRGFQSRNKPDRNAAKNLRAARAAGYRRKDLGVYFYPCAKCGKPKKQLRSMLKNLKKHGVHKHFSTIWLDIEGEWPTAKLTKKQKKAKAAAKAAVKAVAPAPAVAGAAKAKAGKKQPQSKAKKTRFSKSRAFFRALLAECAKLKRYNCGVYTSAKDWSAIMGKKPIKGAKKLPLWYPHVEEVPTSSTEAFESFGGWKAPFFKQYSQKQNVCGVNVDVNVRA